MTGTDVKVADRISDRVLVKDEYLIRIVKTNGGYMKHHHIDESNSNDRNDNGNDVVTTTELSQKNIDISILVDSNKRKFIDIATTDVTGNSMNRNTTTDIDATTARCDGDDDSTNQTNRSRIDHDRDVEVTKKVPMKKRHQTSRPSKEDRLCSYALQGIPCPHDKCSYNHNLSLFLSSKPPDIGDRCYLFDTYGYCSYGITCRFGDSHIDRMTCMNITRSDHQNIITASSSSSTSGGNKQQQINVLSKEVQLHLRKKRYDYWSNKKKKMIVDAVLIHDDVDVVTEVATAAAVDVPVVINTIIANSQIKNDDIAASDDSNGNDGNMRVTFGDTIINNNIQNEYIIDPLSTDTSTTPSTTIITTSTKNDNNSIILSTAPIPMLTPTPPIPIPSQHHSILVPSICLSTITTLHKPVREVSLKPYPTKSMKLLDFSDKVCYLFLLLL